MIKIYPTQAVITKRRILSTILSQRFPDYSLNSAMTGLELEEYFAINPTASVTGIDLAPGMLNRLAEKFPGRDVRTVLGSYFDLPFGSAVYDAAVSVESLHHFTAEEKLPLYRKLREALKPGGVFVLTDYFSLSDEEETAHRAELLRLKKAQNIMDDALYHFDTPLTPEHEAECLEKAGFSEVRVLKSWGATHTLRAVRPCLSAAVGPGAPDTAELGCCGAYCRTCREYMVLCKGLLDRLRRRLTRAVEGQVCYKKVLPFERPNNLLRLFLLRLLPYGPGFLQQGV